MTCLHSNRREVKFNWGDSRIVVHQIDYSTNPISNGDLLWQEAGSVDLWHCDDCQQDLLLDNTIDRWSLRLNPRQPIEVGPIARELI